MGQLEATSVRAEDLAPGTVVGRYVIEELLGRGGMGVVYAARDPALGRRLAIKLLRTPGAARSARLMREARALASVSHPNVLPVHDVGAIGDEMFIAMELVAGKTLKAWLAERRRSWDELRLVMLDAGRGLAAAHAAGLVHRDFKPDNVLVGDDGAVKVMDFGLARESGQEVPARATGEVEVTQSGALMGTVAYMAPEQHQGRPADARADQFSYCVTLYEAVYGERPFAAPDGVPTALGIGAEVLQGHVRHAPPGARVPRRLREVIVRGLAVDPDARHPSMHALLAALGRRSRTWRWVVPAIVMAASAVAAVVVLLRSSSDVVAPAPPIVATAVHRQVSFTGEAELPVLSPDGTRIAYVSGRPPRQRLIVQELRSGRARTLSWWQFISDAVWSPDGSQLLVVPMNENVYVVDASTGARRMLPVVGQAAAWSPDGRSIAVATNRLVMMDVTGANKREVELAIPSTSPAGIDWSRDDKLLVLTVEARGHALWTMRPDGSDPSKVVADTNATTAQMPRWVGDGFRYYRSEGGPGEIVHYGLLPGGVAARRGSLLSAHDLGDVYSSSADGKQLAYSRTRRSESLVRVSPEGGVGKVRPLLRGTQRIFAAACSHDGARIAVAMGSVETAAQVFVMSSTGGSIREVTSEREHVGAIAWSPDGAALAYTVARNGETELRRVDVASGTWTRLQAPDISGDRPALRWAPGGEIYYHARGQTNYVRLDPRTGQRRPLLADDSRGWIFNVTPSPDGARIAFEWNRRDLGRMSLWTASLTDGSEAELSTDMIQPLGWTADGTSVIAGYGRWRGEGVLALPLGGATPRAMFSDVPPELHAVWWVHVPGTDDVIALDRVTQSDVWLTGEFSADAVAAVALPASDPELPPGHPVLPGVDADNLDFEGGTTTRWYVPEDRRAYGAIAISDEACSGTRSLRIAATGPSGAGAAQYVDAAPYRGRRVKLRACMRGAARLWLEAELFDGESLRAESRTGVPRASGWVDHETTMYIPRETQYVEFGATLDGAGTAWLDGVDLSIIP